MALHNDTASDFHQASVCYDNQQGSRPVFVPRGVVLAKPRLHSWAVPLRSPGLGTQTASSLWLLMPLTMETFSMMVSATSTQRILSTRVPASHFMSVARPKGGHSTLQPLS
eukprot:jgi/Botrbrau1/9330/Bobra.0086s0014.1